MDYGSFQHPGVKISTAGFTKKECELLQKALHERYKLTITINSTGYKDKYYLYIWKKSVPTLIKIVESYIIPEMKYKIM